MNDVRPVELSEKAERVWAEYCTYRKLRRAAAGGVLVSALSGLWLYAAGVLDVLMASVGCAVGRPVHHGGADQQTRHCAAHRADETPAPERV